jgi:hypothetical protein
VSQFATAAELRSYLDLQANSGRASTPNLDLLLQAASDFLERETGRIITASASNTARTFSTFGAPAITIPDLRTVSAATLQSTALTAGSTYSLIPAPQQPVAGDAIYTGIQFRAYSSWDYRSNPEWFDRNLDNWRWSNTGYSLPNDLVITGLWGWTSVPPQWKLATLVLAGYEYKRPDSLLANVAITPEGGVLNYGDMPPEVVELIRSWRLGQQVVSV